jgi:hypothetical protein
MKLGRTTKQGGAKGGSKQPTNGGVSGKLANGRGPSPAVITRASK